MVIVCYRPTERERTERLIKMRLREIMMQKDLENVTCKEVSLCWANGVKLHPALVLSVSSVTNSFRSGL